MYIVSKLSHENTSLFEFITWQCAEKGTNTRLKQDWQLSTQATMTILWGIYFILWAE